MAKQKSEVVEKVFEHEQLSGVELHFLTNNRNLTDSEIARIMSETESEVAAKRAKLNLQYEQKAVVPKDLSFNKNLQQWEDAEGNVYNGPAVKAEDVKETVEIKRQVAAGVKAGDLIARNDKTTAAVMTAGASQMADLIRTKQRLIPTCVHQPRVRR